MRDNFSNPNPFLSSVKNYQELLNQPTAGDAMADATRNGMTPNPSNEGEHLSNALTGGFAGGMKAHENQKRQEKLSPMLERAGQITAKAAELEAQMQDETQTKMDTEKFYRRVAPAMLERSKAALAGDTSAVSELDKYIYGILQQSVNDPSLGNYSHSNGGDTFFTNNETGVTEGRNLMNAMYQYGIDPAQIFGKDALNAEIGYSPGAKLKYEDERKMLAAELAQKNSVTSVNNAHAGNFKAQTEKTKHEIKNPVDENAEKLNFEIKKDRAAKNYTALEEKILPKLNANENVLGVYEAIEDIRQNNPDIIGSDYYTQAKRAFAVSFGSNPDIDYATLKSVEFEKMLKPILGAQLGKEEGERVLNKFISLNQNKEAIDKFLLEEKPRIIREIVRDKQKIAHYDKENHANLHSEDIHSNLDQEIQNYSKTRKKTVTMVAPDGSTREVPKAQVKEWEGAGARVVE